MDISALCFGYSKALYSTWIFYKPDHLLVDCGEGAATTLGNGGFAIEKVLLTHGHIDHISGLPSLLWSRAAGMGDTQKPLTIYYPQGDIFVDDMRQYLRRTQERLPFDLQWIALEAGQSIALNAKRRIETFSTRHVLNRLTLGYKIVETRRRLKAEYGGLEQEEIRQRAIAGEGAALMENYEATLAAWGGDGAALDISSIENCELLFHEATILDAAERKHQLHATLDEAVATAQSARVKALVLYHVSGRYRKSEIESAARDSIAVHQIDFPVWCLFRDRCWRIEASDEKSRRPTRVWKAEKTISGDKA